MEPDLEPIITSVLLKSFGIANLICSGSVESKTVSFFPNVLAMTSGARDDPPIPHKMKFVRLFDLTQALRASSWGSRSRLAVGRSIQFKRTFASGSAAIPHRVASLDASFVAIEFRSLTIALSTSKTSNADPEILII